MSGETCWTLIEEAAAGVAAAREVFARRYLPMVRAALLVRWRQGPLHSDVEDAVQDVFVECLREEGVLEKLGSGRSVGFRAFLYGVVRNVARRHEERHVHRPDSPRTRSFHPEELAREETTLQDAFDRAWAKGLLREAAERYETRARGAGREALRRVELLRRHYGKGQPIVDIAREWRLGRRRLYHETERALEEFEIALKEVVAFHHPGAPERVQVECRRMLALF